MFLVTVLIFTSCGGDDDSNPTPTPEENSMTATINGESFTAETTTANFAIVDVDFEDSGIVQESRLLTITGIIPSLTGETETLSLTFSCVEFSTELDLSETSTSCGIGLSYQVSSFLNPTATSVLGTEGVIIIQEISDDYIKGTFSFSGVGSDEMDYNITNGTFSSTINQ